MKKQKLTLLLSIITILILQSEVTSGQKTYTSITDKSKLEWLGEKVTGEHKGTIDLSSGEITMKDNVLTGAVFIIDMNTIKNTDISDADTRKKLLGHLNSEDFFNVNKYPTATLKVTNQPDFGTGSAWVKANLTIKGKTHPVEFRASKKTVDGGIKFYANITIDRTKYDVRYGSGKFFDNLGDKTIYDEFKLKVNVFVKEK